MMMASQLLDSAEAVSKVLLATGGALTPVGVIAGAWWARDGRKHSRQANDAVNNVHKQGESRIYDLVMNTQKMTEAGFLKNAQQHQQLREQIEETSENIAKIQVDVLDNRQQLSKAWRHIFPGLDYDDVGLDGEELDG